MEKGLRGAEDELRLHEREQAGKGFGKKSKMSFWVENNGEWGLLAMDDAEGEDIMDSSEIHWVGSASNLLGIYSVENNQHETMWMQEPDGGWLLWTADPTDGEYYTQDASGMYWAWSDWEANSAFAHFSSDQQKELEEAYAAYEGKMRTFSEARNLIHSKQQSRGFFPRKGFGKTKNKNKGKSKGGSFNFSTSGRPPMSMPPPRPSTSQSSMAMATQDVLAVPGSSGFSGCFICGSLTHGFRECPNRGKGRGKQGGTVFMVTDVEDTLPPSPPSSWVTLVANVDHPEEMGYGVIDTGATESVASLEALEKILSRRSLKFGAKEGFKVIKGPHKTFKFGNGLTQSAESFILLPQTLGDVTVSLGLFTIDASGVPVLIGIRSLEKLGAIIDCTRGALVLKAVDAALLVPLARSKSGHLLLNLCDNWLDGSSKIMFVDNLKEEKVETTSEVFGIFDIVCGHTYDHAHIPHLLPQHDAAALVSPVVGSFPSYSRILHDLSHQVLHPLRRFHSLIDPVQVFTSIFSGSSSIVIFSVSNEQEVGEIFMVNGASLTEELRESDSEDSVFEQARDVLSEEEFVMYGEMKNERQRNEFLLEKCLVRAHGSSEPHLPQLPAAPSDQMNFRALAVLAASSSLHFVAHGIFGSCEGTGQEGSWWKEESDHSGREVRLVQSSSRGSSRSQSLWSSMPRSSHSGTTGPRVPLGVQRSCNVAGLPGLSSSSSLCPPLWGTCNDQEPRTTSSRCDSCDPSHSRERDQGQSVVAERQDHWTGRSGEKLPDPIGKDPCQEGRSQQRLQASHRGCAGCGSRRTPKSSKPQNPSRTSRGSGRIGSWDHTGFMECCLIATEVMDEELIPEEKGDGGTSEDSFVLVTDQPYVLVNKQLPENDMTLDYNLVPEATEVVVNDFVPENVKTLEKEELYNMLSCVQDLRGEYEEAVLACGGATSSEKWDLMELCCEENSLLVNAILRQGGKGGRAGLFNQCDLMKPDGRARIRELLARHRPTWLWLSFPCGATSSIQGLNELTPEAYAKSMARKRKSRRLVRHGLGIAEEHVRNGGGVLQEWPAFNSGWSFDEVERFWSQINFEDIRLDGCMYNLKTPTGSFLKKPWKIRCSEPNRISSLQRLCDGSHKHEACLGGNAKRSALYTPQLCQAIARCLLQGSTVEAYGLFEHRIDREGLKELTTQELDRMAQNVLKLHRRCGHPNNRALVRTLAARGADGKTLAIAEKIHCSECMEGQLNRPATKVSLEKEEVLWRTLQMDNFVFNHGELVHHFLLMVDEASNFAVVSEMVVHHSTVGANVDTMSVIDALESCWIQYFGWPRRIRCDLEGAFRGLDLASYCEDRGIELLMVPAEHHQATGDVERAIGVLRHKMELFLREPHDDTVTPRRAAYAMTAAHNTMSRVGGYSPSQWALGQDLPGLDNVPAQTSEATQGHDMANNLAIRLKAEQKYLELQSKAKISRALNTRAPPSQRFLPGDLIYYKRFKVPSDRPAHELVDVPRLRISRWFGPARVLSVETRLSEDGLVRAPSSIVWAIGQGRLKKFHVDQIRHASEEERLIAENQEVVTLPWSKPMDLGKGQFEDFTDPGETLKREQRRTYRSRSRGLSRPPVRSEPASASAISRPPPMKPDDDEELIPDEIPILDEELEIERLLNDPNYMPLKRVAGDEPRAGETPFQRARREHEMQDRPLHVQKEVLHEAALWCSDDSHDFVFGVEIDVPKDEAAWRQILKDPNKFTAKSIQKGAEVSWHKLSPTQRQAMSEAKDLEVGQWIQESVCQKFKGVIPAGRLLKMRWVLTLKALDDPLKVKCKARIVLLGFSDPDLGELATSAPTLTRRSRQLFLSMCTLKRWKLTKADAKSAFLQSGITQASRSIFSMPVPELAAKMNLGPREAVQVMKAAYGLVSAPREWFLDVDHTIQEKCNMVRLQTDPCIWVLKEPNSQGADEVILMIGSHVDDFLIAGDLVNPAARQALENFKRAYRWSPWEDPPFLHCGVTIKQQQDYGFQLDHAEFCTELKQVTVDSHEPGITESERSQSRALLGSIQWRVLQTAPQHAAKLSWLQSALPRGDKETVNQVNKLCREVYASRHLSVGIKDLQACGPEDLCMVAWTDAGVGNRPDMTSTGGYLVALANKSILNGVRGPITPISWRSGKLARVAKSSLSAEVQALSEGEQELMMCRAELAELLGYSLDLRRPELATQKIEGAIIVDAKSVYDAVQKGETASAAYSMKEKYAALELMSVAENLRKQATRLLWVSSEAQLADGLTKSSAQEMLRVFLLKNQEWNVKFDPEFLAAKKKLRTPLVEDPLEPEFEPRPDMTWSDLIQQTQPPFSKEAWGV